MAVSYPQSQLMRNRFELRHPLSERAQLARSQSGFSLIELAFVIIIIALLLGAILVPLNAQLDQNRTAENKTRMTIAREALLAFAAANGRLPCPDDPATTGTGQTGLEELTGGGPTVGQCTAWDGLLPGATLGLTNLDSQGSYLDGWGTAQNRMRYAVTNSMTNLFTKTNGMKQATFAQMAPAAPNYLFICTTSTGITANNCGTAGTLSEGGNAVFLIYSLGKNATEVLSGAVTAAADEAANLNGDLVFVSHPPVDVAGNVFDDYLDWTGVYTLLSRMVSAGALP